MISICEHIGTRTSVAFVAIIVFLSLSLPFAVQRGKDRILLARLAPASIGLFVADADGRNERPLIPATSRDYNPTFSADGKWIVFTSEREGSADIFRIHPDGSSLERLTNSPSFDDQGVLSPDGQSLVFVSTRENGAANIWLLDLQTNRYRNLTKSVNGNFRPSWSPDGKWIAFTSDRETPHRRIVLQGCCGWELMQFTALYIIRPDGTGLRRLTPTDQAVGSPKWSPDGKRVVFSESIDATMPPQISSLDIESGKKVVHTSGVEGKLSPQYLNETDIGYLSRVRYGSQAVTSTAGLKGPLGAIVNPSWSADGAIVVYSKAIRGQAREAVPLVPSVESSSQFDFYLNGTDPFSVRYSQDGSRVVWATNVGQQHAIEIMDASGSHRRKIFESGEPNALLGNISWSSDERYVAFTIGRLASRNPVTPTQIAVIGSDGSGFRTLTEGGNSSAFPSFSPDGKRLVYRVLGNEQGLRIVTLDNGKIDKLTSLDRMRSEYLSQVCHATSRTS